MFSVTPDFIIRNRSPRFMRPRPLIYPPWNPLWERRRGKWIGIAPFAKHRGKIYPTGEMELVMAELSDREDFTIFLFGGRGYEEALLDQWAFEYPRVKSVAGKYSLDQELA